MRVYNRGAVDDGSTNELVSDSSIKINGVEIFTPAEFNQSFSYFDRPITLAADNILEVELCGAAGSKIKIHIAGADYDLPTITASVNPEANSAGWHNTAATVEFTCADITSGLRSCTPASTISSDGANQIVYGTATDFSWREAYTSVSINLDQVAPSIITEISGVPDEQGNYNAPVTVSFVCHDDLSGIQTCQNPIMLDAIGTHNIVGEAFDNAGNRSEVALSIHIVPASNSNQPPTITSSPLTTINENSLYSYQVVATDPDQNDTLTFELINAPAGMSIDSTTGLINWQTNYDLAGVVSVVVQVSDSESASVQQDYNLTVINVNRAPIAENLSVNLNENSSAGINIIAADPDGDQLTYTIASPPQNGQITGQLPNVTYTPNQNFNGNDGFQVDVSDGAESSIATVNVVVVAVNSAPVISSVPTTTIAESDIFTYEVVATDADGDTLSYTISGAPEGMQIEPATGLVTWATNYLSAGNYLISVAVSDGQLSTSQSFELMVGNTNQLPLISSAPVTTVNENELYVYQVVATDPDQNDTLTYALANAPVGMQIDASSGLINWQTNFDMAGVVSVAVQVADAGGASVQQNYDISVINLNRAPVTENLTVTLDEDSSAVINIIATDPDGDQLTYTIATPPQNGQITGQLPNVTYTPNQNFNGNDEFQINVSDGTDSSIVIVSLIVVAVNSAPVISSVPPTSIVEQEIFTYAVVATDAEGDSLSYSISGAPQGMEIEPTNGLVTWETNYSSAGNYLITVTVTDGQLSADQSFELLVENVNRAPVISSSPITEIIQSQEYSYSVTASDPDSDVLAFSFVAAPAGITIDSASGLITAAGGVLAVGEYVIEISVTDGNLSAQQAYSLFVTSNNQPPVITSTPSAFVIQGDEWSYQIGGSDPDGDSITANLIQAPEGVDFDQENARISWATSGLNVGNYEFLVELVDVYGLKDEQLFSVEIVTADRKSTHEGTEFWIPVSINAVTISSGGTFDINLVSRDVDAEVTIEIVSLNIIENLSLTADQMTTYSFNLDDYAQTNGFALNQIIEDHAIHITSSSPISAYFMNQKTSTTDGFLGLPVSSLGKEYVATNYIMLGRLGISSTVDGGQLGPIVTIVATDDNTQVIIDPIMDILPGGQEQIEVGVPITLDMNRGDVYNLETKGSFKADLTGSMIRADKPIGVLGQMECIYIPVDQSACDHIVEQLPPIESLATEYYTAPFWGRTDNGRFWYQEYGDTFRAVAPFNDTKIYINGILRAHLDEGEYFEFFGKEAQRVTSSQPVLLAQYSNGNQFDDGYRELESNFTDPFMVVVPPAAQFLKDYTINTPARDLAYNFVNLIVPTGALSTLTLDSQNVDENVFEAIPGSQFSYAQLPVTPGSHRLSADEPFGVYVYGYDYFESYGYLGGMAFSVAEQANAISLLGDSLQTLDNEWCAELLTLDINERPIGGARIKFSVTGVTNRDAYQFSDAHGVARFCYRGNKSGTDTVTANLNELSQSIEVIWSNGVENVAPHITSFPGLSVSNGAAYSYSVVAEDPEGDELSYSLIEAPIGMSIDAVGNIVWPEVAFTLTRYNREKVVVLVSDESGNETTQSFYLQEYKVFNTPPEFMPVTQRYTATAGVPYVFNDAYLQSNLAYPKHQIPVSDLDKDAIFVDILNGPEEAYIQRVISFYTSIERENDPRTCEGCTHYLRWIPQDIGEQSFELGLRDARGAAAESLTFTVDVAPNLPPAIVNFNPPTIAAVGYEYSYVLDIANDVQPEIADNRDDLRVVLEQSPSNMYVNLVPDTNTQKLRIRWVPRLSDIGTHTIRLHVDDRLNSSDTVELTINVVDDNQPPVIALGSMPGGEATIPYSYQINASDPDGDALTYNLIYAPQGMTVDATTGVINWLPSEAFSGERVVVRYSVTDARGLMADKIGYINVLAFNNRAPTFIPAYRPQSAKVGVQFVHQMQAVDREGDDPITYGLSSSATGPVIDSQNGTITWNPATAGRFWLSATATDSLGNYASANRETWYVDVVAADAALDANLTVSPEIINLGETVTLSVIPQNEASSLAVDLSVNGIAVTMGGLLQSQFTPTELGRIPVTATITDGNETITRNTYILVRDPNDTTPPFVQLTGPGNLATVTAPSDITGTVQDENLAEVLLLYKRADQPLSGNLLLEDFTELYRGSDLLMDEVIASFDPTMLVNGSYHVLLQARDSNGNVNGTIMTLIVDGDLKIGNFSISFEDLNLPMDGIPISVTRTYDSRRRHEALDMGYGWSVDYQDVRIEESDEPTNGWTQYLSDNETFQGGGNNYFSANAICIIPAREKAVTISLPSGKTEKFAVAARPTNGLAPSITNPDCYLSTERTYDIYFEPIEGTKSTLTADNAQSLYLADTDNGYLASIGDDAAQPVTFYQLTTQEGYIYQLDQFFGIQSIETPNGHTLTYTENGITHSSGKSINFVRDTQGRIQQIIDPTGEVAVTYNYNTNGDLVSVTDKEQATTTYTYNSEHGLIDIIDPLNRRLVRNIYNDDGRLAAQEDGEGNRIEFDHDLAGRESVVTDRNGNATIYYYDDRGNVLNQVDALGQITTFIYDENDNQLSKTDALGNVELATFDDDDNQLTQTDALGNTVTYAYNERGQETVITDALNNAYNNTYDAVGNLLSIEDPTGNQAVNVIATQGRVSQTTDLLGNTTAYTYDAFGNKLTETDSLGNVTTFTYDDNNNVLTESRQRTLVNNTVVTDTTTYEYDARNRVTATINPLGQRTATEYDLAGQAVAEIDSLGRRTEMDYDVYGRVVETRYPDGSQTNSTYDAEGNLLTETDRSGNVTQFEYDALNRQIAVVDALGNRRETEYDAIGRVIAEVDARGNRTEFEYDAAGRRTLTRDALLNEHRFEYDANGNLLAEVDALDRRTEYAYNALDQRTDTLYDNGTVMSDTLDAMGRRIAQTDQAGVTTSFAYDSLGRLISVTDVQGNITSYTYDEAGNKLTQTDAEGRATRWAYDALGRVVSRTLPLGQVEYFVYDANGNMTEHTDFNGNITLQSYDVQNRLIESLFADGSREQFVYDNNSNRTQAIQIDSGGITRTTAFTYDELNRLQTETKPNGNRLTYVYDAAGNKTQLTVTLADNTQQITSYSYDALNRLASVTDNSGVTSYGYDAVGNRASVSYPNGASQLYSYDTLNRLTLLESYNASGTLVQSFDYTLHPTGRRTQIDELGGRSTQYSYDNLYRLTSETVTDAINGAYTASYEYDLVGNRTYETVDGVQTAYSYDANDRLLQTGGTVFTYDNQGNTLTQTLDGVVTSYTYNSQHELISQSQSGVTTSFAYNADGIRNAKADSTSTTNFLIDNNLSYAQVIREENGTAVISYTYGDDLINQTRNGATSYYHYDGLGSTRALSDASGQLTDSYNYEAFGEVLNQTGATENSYLFAGEQFDSSLDQYYLRARYYDQGIGRFTQQDTYLGNNYDPVSLHKYLYAHSDPANGTDPTGKFFLSNIGAAFSAHSVLATLSVSASFASGFAVGDGTFNSGVFHQYDEENVVCTKTPVINDPCNFDNVFEGLKRHPAPFMFGGTPVYGGKETTLVLFGPVVHSVSSGKVTNTTLPRHLLYPGFVDRTVEDNGGSISIRTYGEGSGAFPLINTYFSDPLWSSVDRQIRNYVSGSYF